MGDRPAEIRNPRPYSSAQIYSRDPRIDYQPLPEEPSAVSRALMTVLDMAPVTGEVMSGGRAVGDTAQALRAVFSGEPGDAQEHISSGVLNSLMALPLVGMGVKILKGGKKVETALDMAESARLARMRAQGGLTYGRIKEGVEALDDSVLERRAFDPFRDPSISPDDPFPLFHGSRGGDLDSFDKKLLGHGAGGDSAKRATFTTNQKSEALEYANPKADHPRANFANKRANEVYDKADKAARKHRRLRSSLELEADDVLVKEIFGVENRSGEAVRQILLSADKERLDAYTSLSEAAKRQFREGNPRKLSKEEILPGVPEAWDAEEKFFDLKKKQHILADRRHELLQANPELKALEDRYQQLKGRARFYDKQSALVGKADPHVLELYAKAKNPYFVDKRGTGMGNITRSIEEAKVKGHDAVVFFDITDPSPNSIHVAVIEPHQLRKRGAKFDPDKILSSDLFASAAPLAGAGALVAGTAARQEQE